MAHPEQSLSGRLNIAAAALAGTAPISDAADLLRYLGYDDGDTVASAGRVRMLRAAATFRRLFRIPAPDAPGLVFFGAETEPASLGPHNQGCPPAGVAGSGLASRRAFESCVGEGIEYLSQFAQPNDPLESGSLEDFRSRLHPGLCRHVEATFAVVAIPSDRSVDWIRIGRIADAAPAWLPADLCLRRPNPDFLAPLKLSTGCAAGATAQEAAQRGLLELIERDAVALWWRGGCRPRSVAPDSDAGRTATALLVRLRRGRESRKTTLLDITTDLGIPAVAAFSIRPDGYGFALGMAAQPAIADAARSAIFEMCQSELSLHVIEAKRRESGDAALNDSDRRQYARASMLNPQSCALLEPDPAGPPSSLLGSPYSLVRHLEDRGVVTYSLDLTRQRFDVPVMRVVAPGLQSEPGEIISDRLAQAVARTGGGAQYSGGISLL